MSNESTLAENVILEIAEVVGTEEVSQYGVVGNTTTSTLIGCVDRPLSFDQAYNSIGTDGFTPTPGVHGQKKVMYQGDSFNSSIFYAIGDSAYGCGQPTVNLICGGGVWDYEPNSNTKIIILQLNETLGLSWNGSPLSFWGSCNVNASAAGFYWLLPSYNNNLYSPTGNSDNYVPLNNQIFAMNVQGRCLYIKKQGENKTYCWDVIDSYTPSSGDDKSLILMGNGQDQVTDIQNIFPDLYNNNGENYDWYVSAYIHSGLWDSRDAAFTWDNQRESTPMSYYGERNTSSYRPNECFSNPGYLGLRSSAFEYGYGAYNAEGYDCYELEISVASLNNAKLHIFEGTPDDPNITTMNPPDITTTGVHKICLGALKRASRWSGLGAGNLSGFSGRTSMPGSNSYFDSFAGSVTLLNAQAINPTDPASVVIDYITLTRKEPDLQVTTTPVYGTTYFYDIEELAWNYLDVLESRGVPLSISFSVGDLRDIGKRTSGYSKTFNIPASSHNNEILDPMLSVGAERQNISWMKARIQANGVYVFKGLMRVEEGNTGEGGYYACHIIQDTIDWSQAIGDAKLCDVVIGEDPPLEKSYQNVVDSWTHTPTADNYFWGLVNYGEWYSASIGGVTDYNKTIKDFHPVIFARSLIYKIFESIGYTLVSNFVDSQTFEQLCHPFCSGEEYIDSDLFGDDGSQFAHIERSSKHACGGNFDTGGSVPANGYTRTWYPPIVPGTDIGNNWSQNGSGSYNGGWSSPGDGYTVPFTGDYHIYFKAKQYVSINAWAGQSGELYGQCMKNGGYLFSLGTTVSHAAINGIWASDGQTKDNSTTVFLNAGDHITVRFRGENSSLVYRGYYDVSNIILDIYPVPSGVVPDFEVNFQKVLPCDKQIDYIKGLTEMFNLQWTADEEKKTVYVEPYNDFFGSGKTLDWSTKLDYTTWGDKFIIEELAKNIVFKYKEDSGDNAIKRENERRLELGNTEYKSHTETNAEKFRKDELEMGTKYFHSTLQFKGFGTAANPSIWGSSYAWGDRSWEDDTLPNNPVMPVMWHGEVKDYRWYMWGANNRPEYNEFPSAFKMRILNYYGVRPCNPWKFNDSSAVIHNQTDYPFIGWRDTWLDGVAEDPFCLSWRDHDENGFSSPGLFTKYWKVAYEKMNGGAALRTCWMNLNPVDMETFDFRDLIHLTIDGVSTYWTVNKIIDYKPNQNVLTKVELIEWKQAVDFAATRIALSRLSDRGIEPTPRGSQGAFRRTKDDGLLLVNHTESRVSGTGVSLGRGTVARNNQTVLGNYNQLNSRDILQIGSGIDTESRTTAFAITQDGEVEVHGGELTVEESDGIVHTLVYQESAEDIIVDGVQEIKYQMKTLYLKKENDSGTGGGVSSY